MAMAVATFSCGTVMKSGEGMPSERIRTRPSMIGAKSVPPLAKTYFTPQSSSVLM